MDIINILHGNSKSAYCILEYKKKPKTFSKQSIGPHTN